MPRRFAPSPATAVGSIALFIALGGSGYAATHGAGLAAKHTHRHHAAKGLTRA